MIYAQLSAIKNGDGTVYRLEVFEEGELIHSEDFTDIYKAKSAQRVWWRE